MSCMRAMRHGGTRPTAEFAPRFHLTAAQEGLADFGARVELWGRRPGCRQEVNENDSQF
jgi:hypothetical protein